MRTALKMATYDPTPEEGPKALVAVRVPQSTRAGLDAVIRLWKMYAAARNDETDPIDLSYAVRRLLRTGIADAFGEFGLKSPPTDEAGWVEVERAVLKAAGVTPLKPVKR